MTYCYFEDLIIVQMYSFSLCLQNINFLTKHVYLFREFFAEFLGTFILIVFGDASVAQAALSEGQYGTFFSINWGWGVGVALGVLVAGGVSGAHLNPAVTLALAFIGKVRFLYICTCLLYNAVQNAYMNG